MFDLLDSNKFILIALVAGCFCAAANSIIIDFFNMFIIKSEPINIKQMARESAVCGLKVGVILSAIFYVLIVRATEPIKMIFILTINLGFFLPVFSKSIDFLAKKF